MLLEVPFFLGVAGDEITAQVDAHGRLIDAANFVQQNTKQSVSIFAEIKLSDVVVLMHIGVHASR